MEKKNFQLNSKFTPSIDQQNAINSLTAGLNDGIKNQVLLGVTGSGKTFTMANIIANQNRPTLVIAHNKTLAAQLCNEFREFFPNNRVEYFVSYYDYYQPEAYIVSTDTYIEKDMAINDEIEKLRNAATASLFERSDTIIVASVSCIYGLGDPEEYNGLQVNVREGDEVNRNSIMRRLVEIQYTRNDTDFKRSTFRVKGDTLDIFPANSSEIAVRIEFFGDEIERIYQFNHLTGEKIAELKSYTFFPATHYAISRPRLLSAISQIEKDAEIEVKRFENNQKFVEAQRLKEKVNYDIEMMKEVGYCSGIENYSRYFDGRKPGEAPYTLLDYFPKGFLTLIDESHMTIPQIRAMYNGDRARKDNLINYGFRLQSAYDNRPLNFEEFKEKVGQTIFVSATPGKYELEVSGKVTEQLIRPTGLLDPSIEVIKTQGQVQVLLEKIKETIEKNARVLVTTLTKKMAEDLTVYLSEHGVKARYLHSDIDTMDRIDLLNDLRTGEFDVLVGINLLREGLDLPEVMLVAILDADKEGFLRSEGALIQTIGRAARNSEGHVIMFADRITDAMKHAIDETNRRRQIQDEYNKQHGIIPKTIIKEVKNTIEITKKARNNLSKVDAAKEIERLKGLMKVASANLDFELAIEYREEISKLKKRLQNGK
ncbi:MAG: excinuclease ABC subunit UvrB [Firmicutes bacterium]|nr:excinuclease ABC subunit UvrB [Bacillota bacterium]MDY5585998.1 excinuclease ABC subunit UvrB [Eubacteriales bacterium]